MKNTTILTICLTAILFTISINLFAQQGVGIGVSNPQEKLDVNGAIKIGTDFNNNNLPPTGGAGTIRWNGTAFQGWDGAQWITFGSGIGVSNTMEDADQDTRIQVEETADEDIIRFDIEGTEQWVMDGARLVPSNSGNSVLIGPGAGANDDLSNNQNVFIGLSSGGSNSTGQQNVAIGRQALRYNTLGDSNVAFGAQALKENTTGRGNIAIGANSSRNSTTGIRNVVLGGNAGFNATGSTNVYIGYNSGFNATGNNKLYIENTSSATPLIYGEFDNNILGLNAKVGVGTQTPQEELHVEGSIRMVDGNQQVGFIPVSDANGTLVWTDPATITTAADGDEDAANELIISTSLNGTDFEIIDAGGTNTVDLSSLSNSGTDDQNLSGSTLTGTSLQIDIENGNSTTVDLSSLVNDADADAGNELQTLTISGADVTLSNGGGTVSIPVGTLLEDADQDTKIQVEKNADEDFIRFDLAGTQQWVMAAARLIPTNAGKSVFIGEGAGVNDDLSNNHNVLIGFKSGKDNTTGYDNVAIGRETMRRNISGSANVALGYHCLFSLTTGTENIAIGRFALPENISGSKNIAFGSNALWSNTTGGSNLALGSNSLKVNLTGFQNVALGVNSGLNATGFGNVFVGYNSGFFAPGDNKLYIENSASSSPLIYGEFDNDILGLNAKVGVGTQTPQEELHVEGSIRMVDGNQQAGFIPVSDANGTLVWTNPAAVTTSSDGDGDATNELIISTSLNGTDLEIVDAGGTTIVDLSALVNDTDADAANELQTLTISGADVTLSNGGGTIAIPASTLIKDADQDTKIQVEESTDEDKIRFDIGGTQQWVMTGARLVPTNSGNSVIMGPGAGVNDDLSSNENVFVGFYAGQANTTGFDNVAIGPEAMRSMISGNSNVAMGYLSLNNSTTGIDNIAIGRSALHDNISGQRNIGLGSNALLKSITGEFNVALGTNSLNLNLTGTRNVAIGANSGFTATGSGHVLIGYNSGSFAQGNNKLFIENTGTDSPLIYGEFDNDILGFNAKVGVGTQSPQEELHVEGSIRMVDGNQQAGYVAVADANGTMVWTDPSVLTAQGDDLGDHIATQNIHLDNNWLSNDGGNEGIRINNNGNVGIGISAPRYELHIHDNAVSSSLIEFTNSTTGTTDDDGLVIGIQSDNDGLIKNQENKDLILGTNDLDRMWIKNTGNIGIGLSSPSKKLEVLGDIRSKNGEISIAVGTQAFTLRTNNTSGYVQMDVGGTGHSTDDIILGDATSASNKVGIGTSSPNYLLHVNGTAGKPGGGNWTAASDKRLKENIAPYTDGLQKLLAIDPITFHYNTLSGMDSKPEYVGVIAQELKQVAPYMVGSFDQDGTEYLNVDNSAMVYMLINAVKEQQQQIDELKGLLEKKSSEKGK